MSYLAISVISSLIFPILAYCCLVYHRLTSELDLRLVRLINCGIRFVYDLRRDVHMTLFKRQMSWLSVRGRRDYFRRIAKFNVFNHNSSPFILQLFMCVSDDSDRSRHRPLSTYNIYALPQNEIL